MSNIPITLTGTVATEPQSKTLRSGRACASFRLAVNHWRMDKEAGGFVDDGTSWFGVDCYGALASNSVMSLNVGTQVIVRGGLKIREWTSGDKSGIAPTVVADHVGPDLRFGTANFQRASANGRNTQDTSSGGQETVGSSGGWGALPNSQQHSESAYDVSIPGDGGTGGPDGANGDEENTSPGGGSIEYAESSVDEMAVRVDSDGVLLDSDGAEDGVDDHDGDAIAKKTTEVAAPF